MFFCFFFSLFNFTNSINTNCTSKIITSNILGLSSILNPTIPYVPNLPYGINNPQVEYIYKHKEYSNQNYDEDLYENSNSNSISDIYSENNNLYFYTGVDHNSAKILNLKLKKMITESKILAEMYNNKINPIHLHIQSYGGSLLDTFPVVDTIEKSDVPIYTYIDGYAASAATLISVCGSKRYIGQNSIMLIHQLSTSSGGKYEELVDDKKNMDTFMKIIRDIYLRKSKLNYDNLSDILKHDLWLSSKEAIEYGLVDEIL